LKLATGAGKTTVMAMLIAWQTVNAVRRPTSKHFTRGFLVCAPGLTIKDRLRVLQPNDPDSYYASRELVPGDMLADVSRAKIVITNYHAFKLPGYNGFCGLYSPPFIEPETSKFSSQLSA
jgi:type III restriction enzyme